MSYVVPAHFDRLPLAQRVRLTAEVLTTYTRVRWVMRDDDAERAVARLRKDTTTQPRGHAGEDRFLAAWRLAYAAGRVLSPLPTDSRCLFRSLTVMCMLDRRDIEQTVVIAVRPQPFSAHAWVEVDDKPVLPDGEPGYERLLEL